jgi:hypothetical protein
LPFLRSIITVTLPSSSTVTSIGSIAGLPGLVRVAYRLLLHTHLSTHGTGRRVPHHRLLGSRQTCVPCEARGQATGKPHLCTPANGTAKRAPRLSLSHGEAFRAPSVYPAAWAQLTPRASSVETQAR